MGAESTPPSPDNPGIVDPISAEALNVLDRIRPTVDATDNDPRAMPQDVALAVCQAGNVDPDAPAEPTHSEAKRIRDALGLPDGDTVTNGHYALFNVLDARAEQRWRDLDDRARSEGWDRADFTKLHRLHQTNPDYATWEAGRTLFDPGYRPSEPSFGRCTPVNMQQTSKVDADRLFDEGLREAARVVRQHGQAAQHGVTIDVETPSIRRTVSYK